MSHRNNERGRGRGGRGGAGQRGRGQQRNGPSHRGTARRSPDLTSDQITALLTSSTLDFTHERYAALSTSYATGPTEQQMGLTQYVAEHAPFDAIIKQTSQDFHVHEIDTNDHVVELTSTSLPDDDAKVASSPAVDAITQGRTMIESTEANTALLELIQSQDVLNKFHLFIEAEFARLHAWQTAHPQPKKPTPADFVFDVTLDKEQRTRMHEVVREHYRGFVTDAVDAPNDEQPIKKQRLNDDAVNDMPVVKVLPAKRIRARLSHLTKASDRDHRDDSFWPRSRPNFTHFTLYKENVATLEALTLIATALVVSPKIFQSAGTKDKRACTTQRISAHKVLAAKLQRVNSHPSCRSLRIGNFSYESEPLRLGSLKGNRFDIVLRDIRNIEVNELQLALDEAGSKGFVNYFGMQRFGSGSLPTHLVGRACVHGDWREAVTLLLCPRVGERHDVTLAREYFVKTRDYNGTLERMPHFMRVERILLQALSERNNDFLSALLLIPRSLRLMYVHAWQSYVWNHMVTKRISELPRVPVIGDLVLVEAVKRESESSDATAIPEADTLELDDDSDEISLTNDGLVPYVLTADDIAANKFDFADVVLPLPGVDAIMPEHLLKAAYEQILVDEGVSMTMLLAGKNDFLLRGTYRKILARPGNFQAKIIHYSNARQNIFSTDIDRVEGRGVDVFADNSKVGSVHGSLISAALSFSLPSSTYATCLVRELTRGSTAISHQKSLTAQHHERTVEASRSHASSNASEHQDEHMNDASTSTNPVTVKSEPDNMTAVKSEPHDMDVVKSESDTTSGVKSEPDNTTTVKTE